MPLPTESWPVGGGGSPEPGATFAVGRASPGPAEHGVPEVYTTVVFFPPFVSEVVGLGFKLVHGGASVGALPTPPPRLHGEPCLGLARPAPPWVW